MKPSHLPIAAPTRPRRAAADTDLFEHLGNGPFWLVLWAVGLLGYAVLVVATALQALVGIGMAPPADDWAGRSFVVAVCLLVPLPFLSLSQLHVSRAVWFGRLLPSSALHGALRDHRRFLIGAWLALSMPLLVLRVLQAWMQIETGVSLGAQAAQVTVAALEPMALLALWLGGALLLAAAQQRVLAWPWGLLSVALLLGLAQRPAWGAAALASALEPAQWLPIATASVALAATFAAMLFCAVSLQQVHRRLLLGLAFVPHRPSWGRRLVNLVVALEERWRPMRWTPGSTVAFVWPFVVAYMLVGQFMSGPQARDWLPAWGTSVTPWHAVRLLDGALIARAFIETVVVQPRLLLAPGLRGGRRWLAARMIVSTWAGFVLQTLVWVVVLCLAVVLLPLPLPSPQRPSLGDLFGQALSYAPSLTADLLLIVSVSVWLQGCWLTRRRKPGDLPLALWGLVVGVLSTGVVALIWAFFPPSSLQAFGGPAMWHRGVWHHLGQCVLAGLFTLEAQRVWARVDIGAHLDRQSPPGARNHLG